MPLYHINVTLGDRRDVIVVDHVLQEYGISEQEFYSVWLGSDKRLQGDGDTFENAIGNLFDSIDFRRHMWGISDEMRKIQGTTTWYTPIVEAANG